MREEYGHFERIEIPFNGEILVKYLDENMPKLQVIEKGDWIDLRSAFTYPYANGDFFMVNLGVIIKIPDGHEAILAPRSSTFKNYGLIQTNGIGVIDNSYCGDNDIWRMPVYCLGGSGCIQKYDRIAQFRIVESQNVTIVEHKTLSGKSRGGFGSTGVK